ncbi:Biotin carboxylase [Planctomycetes bacterium Pan216]|uniref:Biotin carboxylase n=1 Tax=Kolteria novifilia TaxID=2527975 RepID=A0A518B054_9BACT|nr:Biotin carboxylase [Planctomycetes bacterium Pan216]
MFQRILIANRGEIALRVIRACKDLGIQSVAVYSEADRDASYLKIADEAICIGPGPSAESYLNIPRIIAAAEIADVEAIHPGYGFLSENPHFAEVCRSCRIEFIGPSHESMRLLGNKSAARDLAKENNVPTVPGSDGAIEDEQEAIRLAHEIGFPVLIKAAAGGGGRGMRVASNDISLHSALQQAQAEAEAAFNDRSVYIEKLIEQPRHIEVQILADTQGSVVHLWERDCSMQRRYQKIVEESPAPGLPSSVREDICKAAVRLIKSAKYINAATCEFLVDKDHRFYFIEANARIQVEHPVTELVTGIDLVKQQIKIAAGEPLPWTQDQIEQRGCAIECRINAEDPEHNFRPSPGLIEEWRPAGGYGVRIDSHVSAGYRVPPNYDSLICKLIVHQPTREEAIACVRRCLDEFHIKGIATTIPLHRRIFRDSAFIEGGIDTKYLERTYTNDEA